MDVTEESLAMVDSRKLWSGLVSTSSNNSLISWSVSYPKALRRVVTGVFLFLSIFTYITSLLVVSNSIQAPRYGINLAEARGLPVPGSLSSVK